MNFDTALAVWLYTLVFCMIVLMIVALVTMVDSWRLNRKIRRIID